MVVILGGVWSGVEVCTLLLYAFQLGRADGALDLTVTSAQAAHNRVRGFAGFPGCTCMLQEGAVKVQFGVDR